jgi:hypothetical protein
MILRRQPVVRVSTEGAASSKFSASCLESDIMLTVDTTKKRSAPRFWNFLRLSLCILLCSFAAPAQSQQAPVVQDGKNSVASPPGLQAPAGGLQADRQTPGSIRGKIVDQSGASIGGARVELTRDNQSPAQEALTDNDGQFSFSSVAPGPFHLTITSEGLAPQDLSGTVQPGETYAIPDVMLMVATQMVEVQVTLSREELATEQIRDQEKQRVFGVIPNFYVTYDRNAVPLNAKQKFHLAWKSSVDPFTFVAVGAIAGINDAGGRWSGYGTGAEGYAKRYGATYADVFSGTYIGGAVLPSLLKQDPRYFYQGTGSVRSRLFHALSSTFICKGDNGKWQPNYSNVGGNIAAGALANLYYPSNVHHGASLVFSTALVRLGEVTVASIFQEFFVPKLTPNLPTRSPSQP